jgi:arabinogalactan oligomer/maltooligosaccharide transport system substrate-binding protein
MKKQVAKVVAGLVVAAFTAMAMPTTSGAAATLRIWADADRKASVEKVANAWGKKAGVTVTVVQKDFGKIRDDLKTVDLATAPDVIVGAHDWVGELAANGSVIPLTVSKTAAAKIPSYALDAFSYANAKGNKVLYGAPVALENVGLVVNTKVATVPTSFADMVSQALAFQKKAAGNFGLVIPGGDAYHNYPLFSGLCGYVFGKDAKGNLDPSDVGVGNAKLLANAGDVDSWNKSGLLSSKVDYGVAKNAFLAGKAAFWVTGPWEKDTLDKSGLKVKIVQMPKNKCDSVPFLGVQGFMVTKFAKSHSVESQARDLVGNYMLSAGAQTQLSSENGRAPANTDSAAKIDDRLLKEFAAAGKGGVPMPNIPEMSSVWGDLGTAWTNVFKGADATPAKAAFRTAGKNIVAKIG